MSRRRKPPNRQRRNAWNSSSRQQPSLSTSGTATASAPSRRTNSTRPFPAISTSREVRIRVSSSIGRSSRGLHCAPSLVWTRLRGSTSRGNSKRCADNEKTSKMARRRPMRTVPEWVGETPETAVPLRVKLRVFDAHGGRCHWSGKKIATGDSWDVDHIQALINGGENRESNLAPILREKHREKTATDVNEKAKVARIRAKHFGLWPKSHSKIQTKASPPWAAKNERRAFCSELEHDSGLEQNPANRSAN